MKLRYSCFFRNDKLCSVSEMQMCSFPPISAMGASHQTVYLSLWLGSSRFDEMADNDPDCNDGADDDIERKSSDRLSLASA